MKNDWMFSNENKQITEILAWIGYGTVMTALMFLCALAVVGLAWLVAYLANILGVMI